MVSLFSRLAFSLATPTTTNYNARLFFASPSARFSLFLAPPRLRFRLSVVPYTCGRAYLACIRIRVHVCARSLATVSPFLFPLSRDMYGFTQTLHPGGGVQIFSAPCLYVFHASRILLSKEWISAFFFRLSLLYYCSFNFEILTRSLNF